MKRYFLIVLVIALFSMPAAADDWIWGARTGIYIDQGDPFLGIEGLTPITGQFVFNPNIEWVFSSGGDLATINADVVYELGNDDEMFWWAGAGLAGVYENFDGSEFDIGANLLGGVAWRFGSWEPYAQVKVLFSDATDDVVAGVGIRF